MTRVFIVDDAPFTLANLRRLLTRENGMEVCGDAADTDHALIRIRQSKPDIVLVDLDLPGFDVQSLMGNVGALQPQPAVVALSVDDGTAAQRAARDLGVAAYVIKPFTGADLLAAIRGIQSLPRTPSPADPAKSEPTGGSRIAAFVSGKGGVGCSTLAINSAAVLATGSNKRTALIDLDFQNGNIARMLRLEPGISNLDVLQKPDAFQPGRLLDQMALAPGGMRVLCAPDKAELPSEVPAESMDKLLVQLRHLFEAVIIDIPPHLTAAAASALRAADVVIVVSGLSDPAIYATKKLRGILDVLRVSKDRMSLVLNRTEANSDIGRAEAEAILQMPASCQLPFDPILVSTAVNRGIPFALQKPEAQVSRRIADLAALIVPAHAEDLHLLGDLGDGEKRKDSRRLFGFVRS